ncbi:MAG: hypothetical protein QNK23_14380 [Crocinitomicaceae bacterium]|nr:hypothetical protein [Crocinitomicaceae bacterium]
MKRYIVLPVDLLQELKVLELPQKQEDKAIKLIGIMLNRANRDSLLMTEYLDLPKNYLREVFGSYTWLKKLKEQDIIQTNEKYHTGQSKRYRINPDFLNSKFSSCSYEELLHICGTKHLKPFVVADLKTLRINSQNLIQISDEYADSITIEDFKINDEIGNDFFEVIDRKYGSKRMTTLERAIEVATARGMVVIKDRSKYYMDYSDTFIREKRRAIRFHYKKAIDKLDKSIYYVHRNTTNNRLDTNITNLCELLTNQIMEDNNLCSLDLSNSQFAIFCHSYEQADNPRTLDFIRFKSLATSGGLYEEVAELLGLESRKEAKSLMFELFFSSHRYQPRHKKKLREHFPSVVSFIDEYKKEHGDNMFSIELQKQEAEIFIDNIYARIKEECMFCLTKHDSVIVHRKDRARAQQIIEEYFAEIGFHGTLKLEQQEPQWVVELREELAKMESTQRIMHLYNMVA